MGTAWLCVTAYRYSLRAVAAYVSCIMGMFQNNKKKIISTRGSASNMGKRRRFPVREGKASLLQSLTIYSCSTAGERLMLCLQILMQEILHLLPLPLVSRNKKIELIQ